MASRLVRGALRVSEIFVAATAAAGGAVLVLDGVNPAFDSALVPSTRYLDGSPFGSYLLPGLVLLIVVAGSQVWAAVLSLTGSSWDMFSAAAAGFTCVIWIYVQTLFIPFSALQALYLVLGLLQIGFVLLQLGVVDGVVGVAGQHRRSSYIPLRPGRSAPSHR